MVSQRGKKPIEGRARSVSTYIGEDEIMIILADILIDGYNGTVWIIVVAGGDDEIRVPALY
ncbi:MAG: hypothetical protein DMG05_27620, partial [Acidobacteria bacterium]